MLHGRLLTGALSIAVVFLAVSESPVMAQRSKAKEFSSAGRVRAVKRGKITVVDEDGERQEYMVQDAGEQALRIRGQNVRVPATVKVTGELPVRLLEPGMVVRFKSKLNRAGKSRGEIQTLEVIDTDASGWKVEYSEEPKNMDYVDCDVIGQIVYVKKNRAFIALPSTKVSRRGRVNFEVAKDATFTIEANSLNRVRKGDRVVEMKGIALPTGEKIVRNIEVRMDPEREAATFSFNDMLQQKFSGLSDEPSEPRSVRSKNFILNTDISNRQAQVLLAKLERMYDGLTRYFGRGCNIIECYVVADLNKWQPGAFPPRGHAKIAEGAGVTVSLIMSRGKQKKTEAKVYSCDKQDVVQHEAVHAFCAQTFGTPGPIWYAEGMAEVGQYWAPGELQVNIDPVVIEYLTNAKPKSMRKIVEAGQITGDSWQAYAWRWALCHMLIQNENYARDFKRLGIAVMRETKGADFNAAFGKRADQISFEYDQFVQNFGNGYRVDLCRWDWKQEPNLLKAAEKFRTVKVEAKRGWQATDILLKKGVTYEFVASGEWQIEKDGKKLTADGHKGGDGRLIGTIFNNFQLSEPFDLGTRGKFTPDRDGQLCVRCQEDWLELGDNEGEQSVFFRHAVED